MINITVNNPLPNVQHLPGNSPEECAARREQNSVFWLRAEAAVGEVRALTGALLRLALDDLEAQEFDIIKARQIFYLAQRANQLIADVDAKYASDAREEIGN